jgi:hypothetical protein
MSHELTRLPSVILVALVVGLAAATATATAQIPPPPATLTGSITDAAGDIQEGVLVEAFIDNTLCGTTETFYAGEGSSRATLYVIDVISNGQKEGCGKDDAAIRLRVGGASGRLAQRAVPWEAGLTRFDIVFGENVTPDPIPTTTPTPTAAATSTASGGAGGQSASETPTGTAAAQTRVATATGTPGTPGDGGVTGPTAVGRGPNGEPGSGGGGGFPLWGTVLLVIAGIAVIGGGAGLAMARARRGTGQDTTAP